MNIICFGDSITEGAEFPEPQRWPAMLQAKLECWQAGAFHVYNRGVGGDTSARGFDRLEVDVLPLLPGVVLAQFGFNDANVRDWAMVPRVGLPEFRKNLREFHRVIRAHRGQCVFVVNHSIAAVAGYQGNDNSYRENAAPYNAAIREVARELRASIIDLPKRLDERSVDLQAFLADDGLHLSANGNRVYADMVFDALRDFFVTPE